MERESSVSRETVKYRQCRMVAEQQDSRILREQCKDASSRKHSTTHKKVEDSLSSATVPPTPRSVTGVHTYSKITKENLLSVTAMQLLPVAAEGDAAELLEKKQVTRPRQAKKKM